MKKVSTAGAKSSKKISQQKLTVGLDLGDRNSWYCVMDEAGRIQLEQRVRTNRKALQEVFGAMPHSRIALEIGTHSPWISRWLSELGHEVIVANARKARLIDRSLLAAVSSALGQSQAPAPEIAVHTERSQDMLRSLHQPHSPIALLCQLLDTRFHQLRGGHCLARVFW